MDHYTNIFKPIRWSDRLQYAAQRVFDELGAGHSESVYEAALEVDLRIIQQDITIQRQVPSPIVYRGVTVGIGYIDLLINNFIIVELKSVNKLTKKDEQQVLKYQLKYAKDRILINFNPTKEDVEVVDLGYSGESGDSDRSLLPELRNPSANTGCDDHPESPAQGSPGDLEVKEGGCSCTGWRAGMDQTRLYGGNEPNGLDHWRW